MTIYQFADPGLVCRIVEWKGSRRPTLLGASPPSFGLAEQKPWSGMAAAETLRRSRSGLANPDPAHIRALIVMGQPYGLLTRVHPAARRLSQSGSLSIRSSRAVAQCAPTCSSLEPRDLRDHPPDGEPGWVPGARRQLASSRPEPRDVPSSYKGSGTRLRPPVQAFEELAGSMIGVSPRRRALRDARSRYRPRRAHRVARVSSSSCSRGQRLLQERSFPSRPGMVQGRRFGRRSKFTAGAPYSR